MFDCNTEIRSLFLKQADYIGGPAHYLFIFACLLLTKNIYFQLTVYSFSWGWEFNLIAALALIVLERKVWSEPMRHAPLITVVEKVISNQLIARWLEPQTRQRQQGAKHNMRTLDTSACRKWISPLQIVYMWYSSIAQVFLTKYKTNTWNHRRSFIHYAAICFSGWSFHRSLPNVIDIFVKNIRLFALLAPPKKTKFWI